MFMIKFNIEAAFITKGKTIIKEEFSVMEFFSSEVFLILYTMLIAPLGFFKKFQWKDGIR